MDAIQQKVTAIIVDKLGVEESEVTMESELVNDLGADSLDTVEIIMEIEKAFNIHISENDASGITTVGQIVEYLEKTLA